MKKNKLYMILFVFVMFFCVNVGGVSAKELPFKNLEVKLNENNKFKTNCTLYTDDDGIVSNCDCDSVKVGDGSNSYTFSVRCDEKSLFAKQKYSDPAYEVKEFKTKYDSNHFDVTKFVLKKGSSKNCDDDDTACGTTPSFCEELQTENSKKNFKNLCRKAKTYKDMIRICEEVHGNADEFMKVCKGDKPDPEGTDNDTDTSTHKNRKLVDSIFKAVGEWGSENYGVSADGSITCEAVIGSENIGLISKVFLFMSVIGVILVITFGASDFIKAIASSDEDALAQAFKKIKYRIISVIILLLLPALVNFVLGLINDNVHYEVIKADGNVGEDISIKIGKASDCGQ